MNRVKVVVFLSLLLIAAPFATAQDSLDQMVTRLQNEIARREAIDHDESIPADLKTTNRAILEKRRAELITAVQARIAALQKYLDTLANSITPEEQENTRASLRRLASATNATPLVTSTPNLSGNRGDARSSSYQNSTTQSAPSVSASFLKPSPSASASATSTQPAPFAITTPADKDKTSLGRIEIHVKLNTAAVFGVQLRYR